MRAVVLNLIEERAELAAGFLAADLLADARREAEEAAERQRAAALTRLTGHQPSQDLYVLPMPQGA